MGTDSRKKWENDLICTRHRLNERVERGMISPLHGMGGEHAGNRQKWAGGSLDFSRDLRMEFATASMP
jgi:hypothetical protein